MIILWTINIRKILNHTRTIIYDIIISQYYYLLPIVEASKS